MVEAGPGLMGGLFGAGLIDEAWVYVAPMVLGDAEALPPAAVGERPALADATTLDLVRMTRMDRDVRLIYRRAEPDA
jgi:riboflavin biosynthesis pyrimidine reductase